MKQLRSSSRVAGATGVLVVLLAAFFISLSNVLAPIIYDAGSNPLTYLTLRFLGFVILCQVWFWTRQNTPTLTMQQRVTAYGSGAAYAIGAGALLGAFAYMPVSLVVLIFYTFPLLTGVFTGLLDRRLPNAVAMICFAVAFLGIALALDVTFTTLHPTGLGLAVLAAIGVAVAYVWNGRSMQNVDSTVTTFHMSVSALVVATAVTLTSDSFVLPSAGAVGWSALLGAILSFAAAFFFMFSGVRMIGPVRTAMIMNLEPVTTIALAILLLSESLSLKQFAGASLIVGAVIAAQAADNRSNKD